MGITNRFTSEEYVEEKLAELDEKFIPRGNDEVSVTFTLTLDHENMIGMFECTSDKTYTEVMNELNGREFDSLKINMIINGQYYVPFNLSCNDTQISAQCLYFVSKDNTIKMYGVKCNLMDGYNYVLTLQLGLYAPVSDE